MSTQHREDLRQSILTSGYPPHSVVSARDDAMGTEPVVSYVSHHAATFDRDEIRRHMTVVVLTPSRVILTHTDEHPGDALLPEPYTTTSAEAVSTNRITSVVVSRIVASESDTLREVVLTIGWGTVSRIDLEPARCEDPDCEADHGYSGAIASDDFSLRISAAADGGQAVDRVLKFARLLNEATIGGGQ